MVEKPSLLERIPLISLPLSASDPSNAIVKFYDRKDLNDPLRRIEIYNVSTAILRIQHYIDLEQGETTLKRWKTMSIMKTLSVGGSHKPLKKQLIMPAHEN